MKPYTSPNEQLIRPPQRFGTFSLGTALCTPLQKSDVDNNEGAPRRATPWPTYRTKNIVHQERRSEKYGLTRLPLETRYSELVERVWGSKGIEDPCHLKYV